MRPQPWVSTFVIATIPAMAMCWLLLFMNPRLGSSKPFEVIFMPLFALSWAAALSGIIYFFLGQRSRQTVICLLVSIAGIGVNVIGILFAAGTVTASFM